MEAGTGHVEADRSYGGEHRSRLTDHIEAGTGHVEA